jgi:hypothetical protein
MRIPVNSLIFPYAAVITNSYPKNIPEIVVHYSNLPVTFKHCMLARDRHRSTPIIFASTSFGSVLGGCDSSVGTATRYGLGGPGIEFRWGRDFPAPVQTGPGPHPSSCTMGTGSFPGEKRPGRGASRPTRYCVEANERVEL